MNDNIGIEDFESLVNTGFVLKVGFDAQAVFLS